MNFLLHRSHDTFEGKKDQLVEDLQRVVADADGLLKSVGNSTAEEFVEARMMIEHRLRDAKSRLEKARVLVTRSACDAADATQEYVRANPWKSFGIPAVAGLAVFLILSRR